MVIHLEVQENVAVPTAGPQKDSETGIPGISKCSSLTPKREVEFYSVNWKNSSLEAPGTSEAWDVTPNTRDTYKI